MATWRLLDDGRKSRPRHRPRWPLSDGDAAARVHLPGVARRTPGRGLRRREARRMTAPPIDRGRAILAAQPFSVLLGTVLTAMDESGVVLELPLRAELLQQFGFAHGGVVSYLADNALTYAGALALGEAVVTVEMKLNYLRPAIGDRLVARA